MRLSNKKLLFVIVAEQGYIHTVTEDGFCPPQNELFFNSVCNTYQPLVDMLYRLEKEDPEMYAAAKQLLNETSTDRAIVETCSHAVYVGRKQ